MRFAKAGLALALFGGVVPGSVRAQEGAQVASHESVARQLFERGKLKWEAGEYAEAVALLSASSEQLPLSGPLMLLADCHERLGRLRTARDTFQRAAEIATRDGKNDLAQRNLTRAAALEQRIPRLQLSVAAPAPSGLQVLVNGRLLSPSQLNGAIQVDAGPYRLEARAPGYRPLLEDLSVSNDFAHTLGLQIVPIELVPDSIDRRTVAYVVGGTGLATLAGTIAVSIAALAEDSNGKGSRAKQLASTWGNVLGVSSVVFLGTSAGLYFTAESAADARGVHGAMAGVNGRF